MKIISPQCKFMMVFAVQGDWFKKIQVGDCKKYGLVMKIIWPQCKFMMVFAVQGDWLYNNYGLAMKIMWAIGLLAAGQSSTMTVLFYEGVFSPTLTSR